jgi:iron complex transport system ATP-binding protein
MNETILAAQDITFSYNGHPVLRDIGVSLRLGELVALLGPNGSGKTTLLKTLCGLLSPQMGHVTWSNGELTALHRREVARRIALVPQELHIPFSFTVREIVLLGRTPHVRPLFGESAHDHSAVELALRLTETTALADRFYGQLSGGEQQRVAIAMALAQEPQVLLLDEPTVHLDINHQSEVLQMVRKLNRERGLTVLATMHDLNLASLYFDRLILLRDGHIVTQGMPREVLSKERVRQVFGAEVAISAHPTRPNVPHLILLPPKDNAQ